MRHMTHQLNDVYQINGRYTTVIIDKNHLNRHEKISFKDDPTTLFSGGLWLDSLRQTTDNPTTNYGFQQSGGN